jgi:hypothetical protein
VIANKKPSRKFFELLFGEMIDSGGRGTAAAGFKAKAKFVRTFGSDDGARMLTAWPPFPALKIPLRTVDSAPGSSLLAALILVRR